MIWLPRWFSLSIRVEYGWITSTNFTTSTLPCPLFDESDPSLRQNLLNLIRFKVIPVKCYTCQMLTILPFRIVWRLSHNTLRIFKVIHTLNFLFHSWNHTWIHFSVLSVGSASLLWVGEALSQWINIKSHCLYLMFVSKFLITTSFTNNLLIWIAMLNIKHALFLFLNREIFVIKVGGLALIYSFVC